MLERLKKQTLEKTLPYILIVGGILGLFAAATLTIEKIAVLEDPSHKLSCSINPVLSCGSVMLSKQASAFQFPNPLIGIAAFAVVITIGAGLLAGAKYKRWFWLGLQAGTIFGVGFIHWLIYHSLYSIGALCLYCMIVWVVVMPIFWYTLLYNLRQKYIKTPANLKAVIAFVQRHHGDILLSWYLIIIALIIHNFWYYWSTLL